MGSLGQSTALSWLDRLRERVHAPGRRRAAAEALYQEVVAQARLPVFYADWGVPDSRDGRLEMVGLHAVLAMRRLRDEARPGQLLAQALFDLMFKDVDRHLREWGVGDLSVGKQVKTLAHHFLGRAATLDPLLDGSDPPAMEALLRRSVYESVADPAAAGVRRLGQYVCAQHRHLTAADGTALLAGHLRFAAPEHAGEYFDGDPSTPGQSRVDPRKLQA